MSRPNIAREAREKYGWEMPTLKLARILYAENPLLFTSVEDARKVLRGIEGKLGTTRNGNRYKKSAPVELQQNHRSRNPYKLPESEELDALYDRFLIRRRVGQVSAAGALFCFVGWWVGRPYNIYIYIYRHTHKT